MEEVKAYRCEHCGKLYRRKSACREHERRCWKNPKMRACITCGAFAFRSSEKPECPKVASYGVHFNNPRSEYRLGCQCSEWRDKKHGHFIPDLDKLEREDKESRDLADEEWRSVIGCVGDDYQEDVNFCINQGLV